MGNELGSERWIETANSTARTGLTYVAAGLRLEQEDDRGWNPSSVLLNSYATRAGEPDGETIKPGIQTSST
jgi:hypothetical protein